MSRSSLRSLRFAGLGVVLGLSIAASARAQAGGTVDPGAAQPGPSPAALPPGTDLEAPVPPAAPVASAPPAQRPVDTMPTLEEAEEAVRKADWAERDESIGESNTLTGGVGLLRTQHAQSGAPGQFRVGFVGEWFSAGFLCNAEFPCPLATSRGTALITSDTLDHTGGTLSLGASLFKIGAGTFEAYLSTSAYANSDSANNPSVLQVLGDSNLAIKYVAPVGDVLDLGLFTELWLINGSGSVGLDGSGTSAKFGGIATLDFRGTDAHVPLRFSVNGVYSLDNTGDVLAATEQQRGAPVTRIERFGLGVNRVDHFDLLVGAEFFVADERVRPFIEAKVLIPNNRQGYVCNPNNLSGDHCMANDQVIPSTLTIGSRFFPWKRGFSLLAAIDIGLGGTSDFVEELQPVPPWTLFLGGGWAVDTQERPPVVERVIDKVARGPTLGHLAGLVHDTDRSTPVADAIVTFRDQPALSPLATSADGTFGGAVPPGQYTLDIRAIEHKPGSCDVTVPSVGGDVSVDCPLEALPRVGSVSGHVRDADTGQGLGGIPLVVRDSQKKELRQSTDPSGAFKLEGVAPGSAEMNVVADGYLVLVTPIDVKPRQDSSVDLLLRPKPKQALVAITPNEITIKQQIQFALDSAVILPESFGLLTEIADVIIRHPEVKQVEVQGHTDNSGTPEHNNVLSEQRAEAVRAWLVQHGVPDGRLVARGYGQDKPLVPNVTPQTRARNRRVQFIILEKEGAPPASALPGPPLAPGERKKNPLPGF
jgi:outer membrane protein OmpA-like peptidoglycan-associated protein